jgi:arabinogalactan endo-1,4-beta-galactosidase
VIKVSSLLQISEDIMRHCTLKKIHYSLEMADPGIGTYVRYWLHYSNLASSFFKQFGAARKIRDDYEKQVIQHLQNSGMENAQIQINNGHISIFNKRDPNPLTLSKIQELLHLYYRKRGGKDETMDIMTFIRSNRGYAVSKSLRQSGISPTPQSSPGTS